MTTARITAAEVKEIIPTKISDAVLTSNMIDTAHVMVEDILVPDAGLTEVVLKKIELYLAAHFVALTDEGGGLTRSKLGDSDESFANIYEAGFKGTRFGQTALGLDTSGRLNAATQTNLKAEFRVV